MLWGGHVGELEVRRSSDGAARLRGRFPYKKPAVLSDGGRTGKPRKEVIEPGAFSYRVDDPDEDIHLLVGHDFDRPLASKATKTLTFRDTAEALIFDAIVTREIQKAIYVQDVLAQIESGLAVGISPGFRIPPKRRVQNAERIEEEEYNPTKGMFGAIIRTIISALLYEISIVTRPAYPGSQVEMRDWNAVVCDGPDSGLHRVLGRWRA